MGTKDVFNELNAVIKANAGQVPDRFELNGQVFQRVAPTSAEPQKKTYRHPRTGIETEELMESVTINVAPYADRVVIDNTHYLANRSYEVPVALARTLRDVCSQTWKHEAQTGGAYSFGGGAVRNPSHLAGRSGVGFA